MSNILYKSFNLCFSKFKCFPTITLSPPPPSAVATPTLLKNFNSLYDHNSSDCSTSKSLTFSSTTSDFSDDDSVPDFASAFASHRFFFSSPGTSNSIFSPVEPPPQPVHGAVVSGGVAVEAYSPDPYSDFRDSMVEMIEASGITDVKSDWEFLTELLLCYLTLNPKHAHKFIVGAFADVVVSLVTPSDDCREIHTRRRCTTSDLSI